eukprot:SAG11_NODE_4086_length_2072_cov_2.600101_2_plen_337_part_01
MPRAERTVARPSYRADPRTGEPRLVPPRHLGSSLCIDFVAANSLIPSQTSQLHIARDLGELVREPVLPERLIWHRQLRTYASMLLENVTGTTSKLLDDRKDGQAAIVAATRVQFDDRELLQIVHAHLLSKGLGNAAEALAEEAKLGVPPTPAVGRRGCGAPIFLQNFPSSIPKSLSKLGKRTPRVSLARVQRAASPKSGAASRKRPRELETARTSSTGAPPIPAVRTSRARKSAPAAQKPTITLDGLVRHYLRAQHARRANPASVVPPFSLLSPRRWQHPGSLKQKAQPRCATQNVVNQLRERELHSAPRRDTRTVSTQMRHNVYSKFRQVRIMRGR